MTARCRSCGRPLRRPSPDGYGPKCRRALGPRPATGGGQLALNIPTQPRRRPRLRIRWPRRYRGREVHTLPDIATYQETH
ncbi:hypothetical protein [Streptomyces cucumeris]|uniref:hypothetical protein n=1 Tax=Streptomyces cucumeris TaxID=2962890 RepID=UPI0020C83A14|nr:hypothetical protein [Streptomyces sp. NEAU-Y11]MCP9205534.1 hypothetical protein [Streptomyces sp. NEAU-Y11]